MTSQEQLALWVEGTPVHRGKKENPDNECCPDFSCCKPDLLQPKPVREAYVAADEATRMKLLGTFLQAALSVLAPDKSVYVAAGEPTEPN
jgi:hypothetical protein